MSHTTPTTNLFLQLAKVSAMLTRRFDAGLGGLSLNEFIILYHLSLAPSTQLRRTDLADKVGLTASGITRLLLPMEKIGLVKRETDETDARVSFVRLASGGKHKLTDALERMDEHGEELLSTIPQKKLAEFTALLTTIAKNI
jgi:DNA-binding MarR family transcriptional regulator